MQNQTTKILLLEDNPLDIQLIENELQKSTIKFNLKVVSNKEDFKLNLINFKPDIIISEYCLPSLDAKEALAIVKAHATKRPFIILTNNKSEDLALEVIKEGGYDYLLKDHLQHLPILLTNALYRSRSDRNKLTHKKREQLLQQTETFAHVGGWQFDFIKGKANWSNETFRMLGYTPGEIEPGLQNFLKCVHPDDLERVKKNIQDAKQFEPHSRKFEARIIDDKTHEIKYMQTVVMYEHNENGNPIKVSGFHHDITAEKLAQEKIILKKRHLLASQKLAGIGSWEIDFTDGMNEAGNPTYWSDELYKIFGLDSITKPLQWPEFMELVHPQDRQLLMERFMESIEKVKLFNLDYRVILPNKTKKIVHTRGELITDKKTNKVLKIIGTTQDITARKEEEEVFRKSEANLRTIFDNTTTSFILVNKELEVALFNKAAVDSFEKLAGKNLLMGSNILDYIMEDRKSRAIGMYKRVFEGEQFKLEDSILLKNGSIYWYYMQLLPVYGENNQVLNMLFYLRDITERKLAEIEREKITADLIQRNKDLEQFSYIVSHNLRLPVANIMGLIENFNIAQLPKEELGDVISALYVSVRALDDVVIDLNKILDLRTKEMESKQQVKLWDILFDSKVKLGFAIKKDNAIIDADFSEIDELFAVKSFMSSIFYNLISNSIKFRQPSLTPHIIIESKKIGNKSQLSFSDNGLGIDLDKNGKDLFGLYKRFHPKTNGKGAGLFIVKTQVEAMGGKITAKSNINKGTTVTIEFES